MPKAMLAALIFVLVSVASMTLLVRLVYRYNAPAMRLNKKKKNTKGAFTATKNRQEKIKNGDYYIVEYVWTQKGKQKDYACRVLGKPPEEIKLKYDWLGRLIVVEGPVDRMDNKADPYIAYQKNPFPKAGYLLIAVPIIAAIVCFRYIAG